MPKTPGSGRKKGTPNKRTLELAEMAKRLKVEPFEIMLRFAKGDWKGLGYAEEKYVSQSGVNGETVKYHIDPDTRLEAASQCAKYLYPQLKSIEMKDTTPSKGPMVVKVQWDDERNSSGNEAEDPATDPVS